MMERLPPLNALRCFLVAAECLSFKRAAERLSVTQAAVSKQIQVLESHLGRPLFIRGHREVHLSPEGKRLLPLVRQGFDALTEGVRAVTGDPQPDLLTISVLPSFASRWLVPRLGRFQDRYPEIRVRLETSSQLETFASGDVDVCIRFGPGGYAGLESRFLSGDRMLLACHPSLLEAGGLSRDRIKSLPFLEDDGPDVPYHWQQFMALLGVEGEALKRTMRISDSAMLVEALLAGQGLAVVRHSIVYELLHKGQLVQALPQVFKSTFDYYLVAPGDHFQRPKVRRFEQWLRAEMAAIEAACGAPV